MMTWLQDPHNWVAISFVIFVIAAIVLGRKPVAERLDARIVAIRRDIDAAEALKNEATALLTRYKQQQADAEAEAARIVVNAREHAKDLQASLDAEMKDAASRRAQQLADRLHRMEEQAQVEMRAYAAELAVRATAELIAGHLDAQGNAKLVDATIRDLGRTAA